MDLKKLDKLSDEEKAAVIRALGGMPVTKTVKPQREIRTDVKIRGKESPVLDNNGEPTNAYTKVFWLEASRELVPGETLYIQTRKPWPAHVNVEELTGKTTDGKFTYAFSFVPRETTKREGGAVKITTAERVDALGAELVEARQLMQAILEKLG